MNQSLDKYFKLLELENTCDLNQVKQSWRVLSQIWHPDKHVPGTKPYELAVKRQQEINEAYATLCKHFQAVPTSSAQSTSTNGQSSNTNANTAKPNGNGAKASGNTAKPNGNDAKASGNTAKPNGNGAKRSGNCATSAASTPNKQWWSLHQENNDSNRSKPPDAPKMNWWEQAQ